MLQATRRFTFRSATLAGNGGLIVRARDGKLVEGWNSFDFLSMYQQIGAVPATGGMISA